MNIEINPAFIAHRRVIYKANGHAIRMARLNAGLGLRQAAKKLYISSTYLSRIENNLAISVAPNVLRRMTELFDKGKNPNG